jgi:Mce-associated membrane protein
VSSTPTDATTTGASTRRRASRAAGPASGESTATTAVRVETAAKSPPAKPSAPTASVPPPPRRPAHRLLVSLVALGVGLLAVGLLAGGLAWMVIQQKHADNDQARKQRFVDTASQTVVNMFSYTPDTIDQSVNRFVDGTSGPLHDMLSTNNNVENLKGLFRDTNATSEAVINGAALEGIDNVSDNASVLVSVRVTVSDIDGVNKPSMPYRMRVIVHEDDNGRMTGYDLKYPDGGN